MSTPTSSHTPKRPVIVIPSIRDIIAERIANIPEDVDILVVDDSDGNIKPSRDRMKVFTYADQREVMGKAYDVIPHKTSACRDFAFYYIYLYTDHDLIITIDDDCMVPPDFLSSYSAVGTTGDFQNVTLDGWYNTISFMGVKGDGGETLYPRGFPYYLRRPAPETRSTVHGRLVCLMGLWNNVLDYNGIDKYVSPSYQKLHPTARPLEQLLTVGTPAQPTKFALCSMNFGFTRDMIPAAYQMPMDREIIPGYPLWRFEDIWGGYVIEALVHKRGGQDLVGIGEPTVGHLKEGNLVRETHGEHYGHLMSPFFYSFIDAGVAAIRPGTYAEMYFALYSYLVDNFDKVANDILIPEAYRPYFRETFQRLERWGALFNEAPARAAAARMG